MKRTPIFTWLVAGLLAAAVALPAAQAKPEETVPALAKAATPPVIDGVLDDPAWAAGLKFDGFKTFKPDYGKDASQRTEAYIAYDAENFYFAFRCYDSDPARIKGAVCKRDTVFQDDLVFVNLDTFNDRQSAFVFMINPCGIQGDGMLTTSGNVEISFDTVWYSAGKIDDQGWTAEARIPLKSLRFPNRDPQTWRVLFIRFFTRSSEQVAFPPLDPNYGSLLGQAQPFELSGLKYKRVAELLPAFTFGRTQEATEDTQGELVRNKELDIDDLSLTGKLGLTSDLTLDGTINPDFSQVEADAGQVDFNQRYSLYYEEKRPFFLEGSELWQFGGSVEEGPLSSLVYTRTIVDPSFGFKLSGKVTPRDTVAAIYAQDNLPGDAVDVHPDFMIGRFKHALKDDAYIGAFYTGREAGGSYNRVGGIDGRFRLSQTQTASFHLFGSLTKAPGADSTDGRPRPGPGLRLLQPEMGPRPRLPGHLGELPGRFGVRLQDRAAARFGLRDVQHLSQVQVLPEDRALLLELSALRHGRPHVGNGQPLHPPLQAASEHAVPRRRAPGQRGLCGPEVRRQRLRPPRPKHRSPSRSTSRSSPGGRGGSFMTRLTPIRGTGRGPWPPSSSSPSPSSTSRSA